MAVAHDAWSESHTGTTGSASEASFTWNHVPTGTPRSALVFVISAGTSGGTNPVTSVTYGGTTMTAIPYYSAVTSAEPGSVKVFFLDNVGSGTKAVVVNRTNNTTVMYAVCATQTASKKCMTRDSAQVNRAGTTTQTGATATASTTASGWSGNAVDDGSPGTNSQRYMAMYSGGASVYAAGTGTTAGPSIDFGNYVACSYHQTTPSQGSATVACASVSDDLAACTVVVMEDPNVKSASVTGTGGGVATLAYTRSAKNADYSAVLTGGGVASISGSHGGVRAATATGGGVAVQTGNHGGAASVTGTGGGVAVVDYTTGTAPVNIDGNFTATGGGVSATSASHGGTGALVGTGGGVAVQAGSHGGVRSTTGTGGGVAYLTGLHAVDRSLTGTGGGVAVIAPSGAHNATATATGGGVAVATGAHGAAASVTSTGGGVAVVDAVAGLGTPDRVADLVLSGGGAAFVAYVREGGEPEVVPPGPRQQEAVDASPRVKPRRRNANVRAYEADDMECMELLLPFLMVA